MKKISKKFELKDSLIIIGTLSTFAGIWMIYPPAALIALGIWLIFIGVR